MKKFLLALSVLASLAMYGQSTQGVMPQIAISEIMYNPPESGTDSLEYIEIYNYGLTTVSMDGWEFTKGILFTFPNILLPAGSHYVLCADSAAFAGFYGFSARQYTQALNNTPGDTIQLKDNFSNLIDEVIYLNSAPWPVGPPSPAAGGPSIEFCDFTLDNNVGANWAIATSPIGGIVNSLQVYGTPSAACSGTVNTTIADIQITEIMYNNPGNDDYEFIEIYNRGTTNADVSGYTFTSGINFTFPNATLPPGAFMYLSVNPSIADNFYGFSSFPYTGDLSNSGEKLQIENAVGDIIDSLTYSNQGPWPGDPDGDGSSLTLCNAATDNSVATNWSAALNYIGNNGPDAIYATILTVGCTVGLIETAEQNGVKLAPNPVENDLYIYINGNKQFSMQVYDVTGKMVMATTAASGINNYNVDALPAGLYVARFNQTNSNSTFAVKFLKK